MNVEAEWGWRIRQRREALGLTRKQLAHQVGCSIETVRKIETGMRHPSQQMNELLMKALAIYTHPSSTPPTNMPSPMTSFIDRVKELAGVQQRLLHSDVRLLTLVGPPGIGKTRLSIQVGQAVLDHFTDGVWFVPLAAISDPISCCRPLRASLTLPTPV